MSAHNIENLLKKMRNSKQKASLTLNILQEVELWERSHDKFVAMLEEEYPLYRDVLTPYIVAIFQVSYYTEINATVNPLHNDIGYNSKIRYNINLTCTRFGISCIFSLTVPCYCLGKHMFWIFVRTALPRQV